MADNKFFICYHLLSLVNIIYDLYSCTLIGENNVLISKEREKEWIKD